jgi:hypothetical protein
MLAKIASESTDRRVDERVNCGEVLGEKLFETRVSTGSSFDERRLGAGGTGTETHPRGCARGSGLPRRSAVMFRPRNVVHRRIDAVLVDAYGREL